MEKEGLQPIGTNLWAKSRKFKSAGFGVVTRMLVSRLPDGKIWLWSPLAIDDHLKSELKKLGEVAYVVAPNPYHHLFLPSAREAFPEARFYAAPGLEKKKKDFKFDEVLNEASIAPWENSIEKIILRGSKFYTEVIFLHKESGTLIVCDFVFNISKTSSTLANFIFKLYGILDKVTASRLVKVVVRDRNHARSVVDKILTWNFDRLSMAHGKIIDSNAKEIFKTATNWV